MGGVEANGDGSLFALNCVATNLLLPSGLPCFLLLTSILFGADHLVFTCYWPANPMVEDHLAQVLPSFSAHLVHLVCNQGGTADVLRRPHLTILGPERRQLVPDSFIVNRIRMLSVKEVATSTGFEERLFKFCGGAVWRAVSLRVVKCLLALDTSAHCFVQLIA